MPPLPTELIDHILSFFHSPFNYSALHSCSLVCRGWTVSAQRILYLEFTLRTNELRGFAPIICTNPYLGSYVELFTVEMRYSLEFPLAEFVALVGQFTRLQHLVVRDCRIPDVPAKIAPYAPATMHSVTYSLSALWGDPEARFVSPTLEFLLRMFPSIHELRFNFSPHFDGIKEGFFKLSNSLRVNLTSIALSTDFVFSNAFIKASTHAQMLNGLTSLHLNFKTYINKTALLLTSVLSDPRCVLQRLSLGLDIIAFLDDDLGLVEADTLVVTRLQSAIRSVHTLRTFALIVPDLYYDSFVTHLAFTLLSTLPPAVSTVELYIKRNASDEPPIGPDGAGLWQHVDREQAERAVRGHVGIADVYIYKHSPNKVPRLSLGYIARDKRLHVDEWDGKTKL